MNQRDQNQGGRRSGGRQQDISSHGRRQESGTRYGRDQDEDRDWQSQQRYGGSRMSGSSAGQRFGETYNPEPQWLREDREFAGSRYGLGEEDREPGYRSSSEYEGRGSYASSGRPWGEQQGRFRGGAADNGGPYQGARGYQGQERASQERASQERGYQERDYLQGSSRQSYGSPDYGSQSFERNLGGRSSYSGYGASRGGGLHEYGTPGYETAGYDREQGYSGQSMSGRGYGSEYRAGTSTGYGSGGYGSSSGYQLGMHQSDLGYQRSYRGMGPQNYKRPDERIRDDVYERLTDSHDIDARHIMVDVNQGNVTLTGTVPERQMRYAAEDLVEGCMGVSNINNQLKVQDLENLGTSGATTTGTTASPTSTSTESKRH